MLHRCPVSFGRPHRWKRWDFGALTSIRFMLHIIGNFHIDIYLDYPVGLSFFTRFDPVRVEIVLIYFKHVGGTSCWMVIVLITTGLRFCTGYYVDIPV